MDPIVWRGDDRYIFFFARDIMHAERKKYLLYSISFAYRGKKREKIAARETIMTTRVIYHYSQDASSDAIVFFFNVLLATK